VRWVGARLYPGVDSATRDLLTGVMDEAWREAEDLNALEVNPQATHAAMVLHIVEAVDQGERDPAQLKKLALEVARARQVSQPIIKVLLTPLGLVARHYRKLVGLLVR
jgi:hypothetical protein